MNVHVLSTHMVTVPWWEGPLLSPESTWLFMIDINLIQGRKENALKAVKQIIPGGTIQQEVSIIKFQGRSLMRPCSAQVSSYVGVLHTWTSLTCAICILVHFSDSPMTFPIHSFDCSHTKSLFLCEEFYKYRWKDWYSSAATVPEKVFWKLPKMFLEIKLCC